MGFIPLCKQTSVSYWKRGESVLQTQHVVPRSFLGVHHLEEVVLVGLWEIQSLTQVQVLHRNAEVMAADHSICGYNTTSSRTTLDPRS